MRLSATGVEPPNTGITALLGPTNTGKTHRAIEQMLRHRSGMIGLPLRLLAREVYDRVTAKIGEERVALVTGEEQRIPPRPNYWICTVESMPDREVDFVAVDEIQLAAHPQRGHTFTDRLLHARGKHETWFLGADTIAPLLDELLPTATIENAPRLSKLSYTGTHGLGSLPPRTAVVAFSAEAVYSIAEALRQQHGGAAVVLGALSPRTRNAQVAMYQAGEVQHLVATDAIGMGLNMDVDRVVFAALAKFDGREHRPLDLAELAQIAGRAGRFTRDGGFGTLRPLTGLSPRVVDALEHHRFAPLHRLVWRNSTLDFSSVENLLEALRTRPRRRSLRLVDQADDYEALTRLVRIEEVRALARTEAAIELLWEVCRIPDYRKLLVDSHVQLLAAIFQQLCGPAQQIDEDWMAGRIKRLDDTEGDIDTLMSRIAFTRTWTYITHRTHWVPNAEQWQETTRQIEDRHSDALHERLTARFVDRIDTGARHGRPRPTRKVRKPVPIDPQVVEDSPFAALLDLSVPEAPGQRLPHEVARAQWVQRVVDGGFDDFAADDDGFIRFEDEAIARLSRGPDLLHPAVHLHDLDDLGAGAQRRIERRMQAWARDLADGLLAPLRELEEHQELRSHARGLLYQLAQGLGTVARRDAAPQLGALRADSRARLAEAGVVIGGNAVFLPALCKGWALRRRRVLIFAWTGRPAPVPERANASFPAADDVAPQEYVRMGFIAIAGRAIRVDQLERMHAVLEGFGRESFELPAELGSWIGCRRPQLEAVVRALGYRAEDGRWSRRKSKRRPSRKKRRNAAQ